MLTHKNNHVDQPLCHPTLLTLRIRTIQMQVTQLFFPHPLLRRQENIKLVCQKYNAQLHGLNINNCTINVQYKKIDGTFYIITVQLQKGKYPTHKEVVHEIGR